MGRAGALEVSQRGRGATPSAGGFGCQGSEATGAGFEGLH
jgi:hypothetical protein